MHFLVQIAAVVLSALLAGCAGGWVQTRVTVFADPSLAVQGQTIKVMPVSRDLEGSLEFATYRAMVETRLRFYGFVIANESPRYVAVVAYGIDDGRTHIAAIPIYGQTGGGTTHTSGTVHGYGGSATYSGTSYQTPTYGQVGTVPVSQTTYGRVLALNIYEVSNEQPRAAYELRAASTGSCGSLPSVFEEILDAAFQVFPQQSGSTRTARVPWDGQC